MKRLVPAVCFGALALALALVDAAHGAERFWIEPTGGAYGDQSSWDGGSSIPGSDDIAIFSLLSAYTVSFDSAHVCRRAVVRDGAVIFALDPVASYTLDGDLALVPALTIGEFAGNVAILEIEGGEIVAVIAAVAVAPAAFGELTVRGGCTLAATEHLIVGHGGVGLLSLVDGGAASCPIATLGYSAVGTGTATIEGAGAVLDATAQLTIGRAGEGSLTIGDGAAVTSTDAVLAQMQGSSATVIVRDAGTSWTNEGSLDVGMNGDAALLIEEGALLTTTGLAIVGTFPGPHPENDPAAGGNGAVDVRSGARWSIAGDLDVGFLGVGSLTVTEDAHVTVGGDLTAIGNVLAPVEPAQIVIAVTGPSPVGAPIAVAGTAVIEKLAVVADSGFVPDLGVRVPLLAAAGGVEVDITSVPAPTAETAWVLLASPTQIDAVVVPVECTSGPDCNVNGISDDCETSFGITPDCNGNAIPDECEVVTVIVEESETLAPVSGPVIHVFTIEAPPVARDDVELTIVAVADLNGTNEYVQISLNGAVVGTLFDAITPGLSCPAVSEATLVIDRDTFNSATAGGADAVFLLDPSTFVNPNECAATWMTVTVTWLTNTAADGNGNAVPDACETCPGDVNHDGAVGFSDLTALLVGWGACAVPPTPCAADFDFNGSVGFGDLVQLLVHWGPCA